MTNGGAEAVGAGVSATDDDDVLVGRDDLVGAVGGGRRAERDPVGLRQELHGLVDPGELAAGHRQLPAHGGADREHHRVVAVAQLRSGQVIAHLHPGAEDRALALHLGDSSIDLQLLHLELGDAIAKQPTGLVVTLVDRDGVAGPRQLLGGRQTSRA